MRKNKVVQEMFGEEVALTPSDICNREFRRAVVRGYAPGDVDRFLEQVADTLESLVNHVRALRERVEEQKGQIEEYRQMEATLRSALVSSQKFGEDVVESARRQADALLEEARLKGVEALHQAEKIPEQLKQDIGRLEQQRDQLRQELLEVLDFHKSLIEQRLPAWDKPSSPKETSGAAEPSPVPHDNGLDDEGTG